MSSPAQWFSRLSGTSRTVRLLGIGLLVLLLRIPIAMIDELVVERRERGQEVTNEITASWGGAQTLLGPALVVPVNSFRGAQVETQHAVFLPLQLRLRGSLKVELRRRGIFPVPVFALDLGAEGRFGALDPSALGVRAADLDWQRAVLALGISDVHAISGQPVLSWNGSGIAFQPGVAGLGLAADGVHAPVAVGDGSGEWHFSFPLKLNGSGELMFVPFAEDTSIELDSNFPHPSFHGKWLPDAREIGAHGFSASWNISFLGRGYAQSWIAETADLNAAVQASRFGLEVRQPVDRYLMSERSVKYALLFVLLTFVLLWLVETFAELRIHPIQYLLFGAALCLFYLLLLSLSEHLGFGAAYGTASLVVVLMVTGYGVAVLQRRSRALTIGAACAALYGWLYFLLANEDYSLLAGSLVLCLILGGIMYCTRHRNWYTAG